ncbi:MAG: uracil-DNA glycosylase [Pseudomonadota bacterium]
MSAPDTPLDTSPLETSPPEPPTDCDRCPRLAAFRAESAAANPGWFAGAVPSFGDPAARLLIVGLAPGLQGAHRTGRPFTGDYAGDLLYAMLAQFGWSEGTYDARADDGLRLRGCMITNAVRCVPPQNKPTGPEINSCRPFLAARVAALPELCVILALGKIAHDSVVRAAGLRLKDAPFVHGALHDLGNALGRGVTLADSYHCSRYNTNTRRLTPEMFAAVFEQIGHHLDP